MDTLSRLPLNALRVFDAVARYGSMAKAAEALSVQPSAVSMQITNLNDYLGSPLFLKRAKRLELTKVGAQLLPKIRLSLHSIDAAVRSAKLSTQDRPFTLSVLSSYLHCWLLPRLPLFEAQHADFKMQILTSRELVDVAGGAADAAVRLGAGRWPQLRSTKLMDEWLVPVASPAVADRFGPLKSRRIPVKAPLLHNSIDPWTLWTNAAVPKSHSVQIDDTFALLTAAEEGQGIALVRQTLCQRAFATKRLVRLGEPIPYRFAHYFVEPKQTSGTAAEKMAILRSWLKEQSEAPLQTR
jgi:LysR family transcriptional regulator, glycine cleavage system transcriptional activator